MKRFDGLRNLEAAWDLTDWTNLQEANMTCVGAMRVERELDLQNYFQGPARCKKTRPNWEEISKLELIFFSDVKS